jgi:DNA-binding protein WhiA
MFLYGNRLSPELVRIVTESTAFTTAAVELVRSAFGLEFDSRTAYGKAGKVALSITSDSAIATLYGTFGLEPERDPALHINLSVIECEECRNAFVRGAFLTGGSIADPVKRYHLELTTAHYYVDREMQSLLREFEINPKSSRRGGNCMLYLKRSGEIEDMLTFMGAPLSAMAIMNAKLEKELRSGVSRRVNCDSANAGRIANASVDQIAAIRRIYADGSGDELTPILRRTAELRLKYPEASLAELAQLGGVSKSGLAHRLSRIMKQRTT